jgi:lia operon protein LiaG
MEGITEIRVKTTSTSVHLIQTQTGSELKCHLYGKAKFGIKLTIEMIDNAIVVEVKDLLNGLSSKNIILDVYIPDSYKENLVIHTTSGIVETDSIRLTDFTLHTSSGGFDAEKLTADVVSINTTSGNIKINELDSKELSVKGSSANVLISCKKFNIQNTNVGITSGNITLELPEAAEFSYKINSTSGKVKSDFPINTGNTGKKNPEGQIGSKDNKLSLQVTSGDIAILKNNY